MEPLVDQLLALQKKHAELLRLQQKARRASLAVGAKERQIAEAQAKVDQLDNERKTAQRAADAKELHVRSLQDKIAKYRQQLNEIKTNEQYKAVQNEIKFTEIELRKTEDEELGVLDELEARAQKARQAQERLKKLQSELEKVKAETSSQAEALDADVRKAERDREDMARELPVDAQTLFDRVAAKHEDGAMAPLEVDDGDVSCGGCYMQLTQNIYVRLLGDRNELITCPTCGRILYVEP